MHGIRSLAHWSMIVHLMELFDRIKCYETPDVDFCSVVFWQSPDRSIYISDLQGWWWFTRRHLSAQLPLSAHRSLSSSSTTDDGYTSANPNVLLLRSEPTTHPSLTGF